jgi:urease accessory protein
MGTTGRTTTIMTTERDLLRLMAWLSPAFPVGAFGYSHGLETAIRDGRITRGEDLCGWLTALLDHGAPWTDAVLFKAAWSAADDPLVLAEVAELALALPPSAERRRETTAQGEAFLKAAAAWGAVPPLCGVAYPVAVGLTCAAHGLPLQPSLAAWLHAFCANLVSVAVRLVPLGQKAGVAVIAGLEERVLTTAARAAASTLDDLGSAAFLSDIAAMRHETLETRIFVT